MTNTPQPGTPLTPAQLSIAQALAAGASISSAAKSQEVPNAGPVSLPGAFMSDVKSWQPSSTPRLLACSTVASPRQASHLAIEYIEGLPLDEYCRVNGLSVRHRLELLRRVCDAVNYAHRRLIVHRDPQFRSSSLRRKTGNLGRSRDAGEISVFAEP